MYGIPVQKHILSKESIKPSIKFEFIQYNVFDFLDPKIAEVNIQWITYTILQWFLLCWHIFTEGVHAIFCYNKRTVKNMLASITDDQCAE